MLRAKSFVRRGLPAVAVGALLVLGGPAATGAQIVGENEQEGESAALDDVFAVGTGGGAEQPPVGTVPVGPVWADIAAGIDPAAPAIGAPDPTAGDDIEFVEAP